MRKKAGSYTGGITECYIMASIDRVKIKEYSIELTEKELQVLEDARKRPVSFDEDCPETTPERAIKFKRVNPRRLKS